MKALVVGFGSIGRRHAANLLALNGIERVEILTARSIPDDDKRLTRANSLESADADFAVIANETDRHAETALKLMERGVHLFIEKPLAATIGEAEAVARKAADLRVKVFVGYNLRFLGALKILKEKIADGAVGKPYCARFEVGQYLPDWRPDRDYRKTYSASAAGGGVALDLSHEIDAMRYLFGDPLLWKTLKLRSGTLEIESDDIFEGIYEYANGLVSGVHADYLAPRKKRLVTVAGSGGEAICDIAHSTLDVIGRSGEVGFSAKGGPLFDAVRTYADELESFVRSLTLDTAPEITADDGVRALRLTEDGSNV